MIYINALFESTSGDGSQAANNPAQSTYHSNNPVYEIENKTNLSALISCLDLQESTSSSSQLSPRIIIDLTADSMPSPGQVYERILGTEQSQVSPPDSTQNINAQPPSSLQDNLLENDHRTIYDIFSPGLFHSRKLDLDKAKSPLVSTDSEKDVIARQDSSPPPPPISNDQALKEQLSFDHLFSEAIRNEQGQVSLPDSTQDISLLDNLLENDHRTIYDIFSPGLFHSRKLDLDKAKNPLVSTDSEKDVIARQDSSPPPPPISNDQTLKEQFSFDHLFSGAIRNEQSQLVPDLTRDTARPPSSRLLVANDHRTLDAIFSLDEVHSRKLDAVQDQLGSSAPTYQIVTKNSKQPENFHILTETGKWSYLTFTRSQLDRISAIELDIINDRSTLCHAVEEQSLISTLGVKLYRKIDGSPGLFEVSTFGNLVPVSEGKWGVYKLQASLEPMEF